jgi:molybdopterin-guanine dinucleotide biosynthesis protein A
MGEPSACLARTGGLLLAGGQSRRFGAEKAVARFGDGLMVDAVAERFAPLTHIAVSARPNSAVADHARSMRVAIVPDDPALPAGPLAGVLAGLDWALGHHLDFLATAPCDAPLLPRDLFWRLLNAIGSSAAAFAITASGEHPLCTVWDVRLRGPLQRALEGGVHPSVRSFLHAQGAQAVSFDDARAFANANTTDALAAIERSA